jgi:transposase-like protein
VVAKVERNQLSVSVASREYGVSPTTVYQWIHKYSTYNKAGTIVMVVKTKRAEQLKNLTDRIAEL